MALHSHRVLELPSAPPEPEQPAPPPPPSGRTPWFCYTLIAVSVAVMLVDSLAVGISPMFVSGEIPPGIRYGAIWGPAISQGEVWRLFTTLVVHGGLLHIAFNMSAVWNLGRVIEQRLGTPLFSLLSVVGALGSGLFALYLSYDVPTVGASGMILAWAGALLPIASRAVRSNLWSSLLLIAVISLMPGISWQGHLGGFLFGLAMGFALRVGRRAVYTTAALLIGVAVLAVPLAGRWAPELSLRLGL